MLIAVPHVFLAVQVTPDNQHKRSVVGEENTWSSRQDTTTSLHQTQSILLVQILPMYPRVKNLLNFPFLIIIDLNRFWWLLYLPRLLNLACNAGFWWIPSNTWFRCYSLCMKCKEARRSGNVNRVAAYKEQSLVMHCGNDHACVNFIKQEAVFVMATIQSYLSSP